MTKTSLTSVPRIESLHHRLKSAKNADGKPIELLDELMVFLEDPPPGIGDRWQAGAELCAAHGIETSRMSVWRFYRVHALAWRQAQTVPVANASAEATVQALEQARHLVAIRALETLQNPSLAPRVLVGLVQNENRRQEILLAREKFNDQIKTRRRHEREKEVQRVESQAQFRALFSSEMQSHGGHSKPQQNPLSPNWLSRKPSQPESSLPAHNT